MIYCDVCMDRGLRTPAEWRVAWDDRITRYGTQIYAGSTRRCQKHTDYIINDEEQYTYTRMHQTSNVKCVFAGESYMEGCEREAVAEVRDRKGGFVYDKRCAKCISFLTHKENYKLIDLKTGEEWIPEKKSDFPDPMDDKPTDFSDPNTGAVKAVKEAQLSDMDAKALYALARVSGQGSKKHGKYNWAKGYDWSLSYDAMMRHAMRFWDGEDIDPETGHHHMAHAAWHALTLVSFTIRGRGTDDRNKEN